MVTTPLILVPDISNLNKSFNGATFGFGIDLKSRKNDNPKMSIRNLLRKNYLTE